MTAPTANLSFKASDIAFEVLTETRPRHAGALPGAGQVGDASTTWPPQDAAEVADWVKTAHGLVAAKLTEEAAGGARDRVIGRAEVEALALACPRRPRSCCGAG